MPHSDNANIKNKNSVTAFSETEEAKSMPKQVFSVVGDNKTSALELLHQETSLTKTDIKDAAMKGAIWINRSSAGKRLQKTKVERLRRLKKILLEQQTIDFYYQPDILNKAPLTPELLDDQQSYSVWIKPRGMLSQGSKWGDHNTLYRWVEMHYHPIEVSLSNNRQCWIVHRLDRATCGIMLLAHSKKMAHTLSQLFEQKQIQKTYMAWAWGKLPSPNQTLTTPIDEKHAITHLSEMVYDDQAKCSLLKIKIETGRKHQIRKHLAEINHPIIGDRLYGSEDLDAHFTCRPDLQLTACQLEFTCPISGEEKTYKLNDSQLGLMNINELKPSTALEKKAPNLKASNPKELNDATPT